jgi:hypothetical protein
MVTCPRRRWTKWTHWVTACVPLPWLMAANAKLAPLDRLDAFTRAKLMMAILGLVLLGVGLVVMVMMGGRYVRRLARHRPEPPRRTVVAGMPKRPVAEESPGEEMDGPPDDDNPPSETRC